MRKIVLLSLLPFLTLACKNVSSQSSEYSEKSISFQPSSVPYAERYEKEILPYLQKNSVSGYFTSAKPFENREVKIAYRIVNAGKPKAIFIFNGQGESYIKYNEFVYEFANRNFTIYQMDPRGQGASTHFNQEKPQVTHLDKFENYVHDFVQYLKMHASKHSEIYLFSHSTGGLVTVRFLQTEFFSLPADIKTRIKKAVLSAPLLGVNAGWIPGPLAWVITAGQGTLGKGAEYVPGGGDHPLNPAITDKTGTSDGERYAVYVDYLKKNPRVVSSSPSNRWLSESYVATQLAMRDAKKVNETNVAILLFQAENDAYVLPEPQVKFCEQVKLCQLIPVRGSRHEIYFEKDQFRLSYYQKILDFFSK